MKYPHRNVCVLTLAAILMLGTQPQQSIVRTRGHHINGIGNFWSQAKRLLRRFNGIPKDSFYWFLKECDWRFNGGSRTALLHQLNAWYRAASNRS